MYAGKRTQKYSKDDKDALCSYHATYAFFERIYTLQLRECQGTSCSKRTRYLKFQWLQQDLNAQPFSSETNSQPFSQNGDMVKWLKLAKWLSNCLRTKIV